MDGCTVLTSVNHSSAQRSILQLYREVLQVPGLLQFHRAHGELEPGRRRGARCYEWHTPGRAGT